MLDQTAAAIVQAACAIVCVPPVYPHRAALQANVLRCAVELVRTVQADGLDSPAGQDALHDLQNALSYLAD